MKEENNGGGASSFMQSTSMSFNSSNDMKYGGLIEKTMYKKLLRQLSQLFSYVYSDAPSFPIVHSIITVIRLLQLGGPALCAGYESFWSNEDSSRDAIGIVSIFFHLVPPQYRDIGGYYFAIIYIVILALLIITLFVSAIYYQKNASLPGIIPPVISFYFASFGNILHPIAFELCFSELSRVLFMDVEIPLITVIILVSLAVLISFIYFWIFLMIASQSLMFRHNSLLTVTSPPQMMIFIVQIVITTITAMGECINTEKYAQGAILIVSGLIYFASILVAFYYGGIISTMGTAAYISTCFTGGLFCIVAAVCILIGKQGNLIFIVGFIIVWVVSMIVSTFIWNKKKTKHLQVLDEILDDTARFEDIKSVNSFVNIATDGFLVAHPVCINWQLMKLGIERWPKHQMTWFIYAKFVSIYPEETQTLVWIFRMIITNKVHGTSAKTVKEQSMSIARLREPNLSTDLKTKLNSVSKHVTSTKHKLRHVWDLAIQVNINDMEGATKRAISEIEQSDAEIMHIYRQFPNNRFVTRQYARFCRELKADHALYLDMLEKTRMLQRGITVNKDQAHEFGLAVFPQLPDKVNISKDSNVLGGQGTESMTTSQMEIETEEENNQEADDSLILVQRIDSLVIPSTRYTTIYRIAMFIILFIVPIVFIFIYLSVYVKTLTRPLQYMQSIAKLRTFLFQMVAFSLRRVYEILGMFGEVKNTTSKLPSSVGSSWRTLDQLIYVTSSMTTTMQTAEEFRTYDIDNDWIIKSKSCIFDSNIEYSYYEDSKPNAKLITMQSALADFVLQQTQIMEEDCTLENSVVNSSVILNLIMNVPTLSTALDNSLTYIINYISEENDKYQKLFNLIMIVVIVVVVIAFSVALIIQLFWINSNKEQVYRCLTSLPKNAVSALTENLRVLKKEAENSSSSMVNTEMNKQEDNIMKMFVVGGSGTSTKLIDIALLIVCSVVIIGLHIGCTIVIMMLMRDETSYLIQNCPHLNYLQGAIALMVGSCSMVTMMIVNDVPEYNVYLLDKPYLLQAYETRISTARNYYHNARFGVEGSDIPPYSGFRAGVLHASSEMECPDPYAIPVDLVDASQCYSADLLYVMLEALWNSRIVPFNHSDAQGIDQETLLEDIWGLIIFPIYDAFFYPMVSKIVDTIESDMLSKMTGKYPVIIVMFVIAFLFECVATIQTHRIESHMRGVLRLLLHAPSKVVTSTPKIMKVLGGDFRKNRGDGATRDTEFFRAVVTNLPDAIVITDTEHHIETINKSLVRILNTTEDNIIGKPVTEVFDSRFTGDVASLLQIANGAKPKNEQIIFHRDTDINLEATSLVINNRLVLLFRDTTQTVRYNTLINEEKSKSDVLLSSILPPSLVKRVQAGEKNISFAVQTATILFLDIVSFTPWCGSLPADKVMMTLNLSFKKFDARLATYSTMTKIKCIGDCYMAAGGVFAEVNQPAEHAKEVTSFGLDALACVEELNKELNEKLQIRVGINTGGPIVAGVLGIGKPTFEILGPAINMAQQMEHHGVPMAVHVSRSVYELIYGDSFVIKERGAVEVKNGSVITYLASR
ncbi:Adenylate and Guanylate cyclase catalytic domain containing protein [Tritrichomonas foetus]|uniref:Adenylate and Guanylate cyclase catalytic domain containing protein n=1 Tax=Tritrichomonas foetus TaxID=1144522 RepID=A0A1J4KJC1_9EUKA|nr:Adenylate and Guanylate cyclase catalytic domain containing protein [Tritrichomonas foetus]|eukprot:OHT09916.1 Adenylate and Guanylate cyclase catalytic domain containing protein [Tritrichomonas foetus]